MSVAYTDIIANVKKDVQATDSRLSADIWMRWAKDCVVEVFLHLKPDLRIQEGVASIENIVPGDDSENIPVSLEPYKYPLQKGVEWRYHASDPKNADEQKAASACYIEFLSGFGVNVQPTGE